MIDAPRGVPSAGRILERSFSEHRRRFPLWCRIMLPAGLVAFTCSLLSSALLPMPSDPGSLRADPMALLGLLPTLGAAALVISFVTWLAQCVTLAAVVLVPGTGTTRPEDATAIRAWTHLTPMAGHLLALGGALFAILWILPLLIVALGLGLGALVGMVASLVHPWLGVLVMAGFGLAGLGAAVACVAWLGARYALSVPVLARDGAGAREALAASSSLTAGSRLRVLLVCFLAIVAASIASFLIQAPVAAAGMVGAGDPAMLAVLGAVAAGAAILLAAPFPLIAVALLHQELDAGGRAAS